MLLPKKGERKATVIRIKKDGSISGASGYTLINKDDLSDYLRVNHLTFKDSSISKIVLKDEITGEYSRIGTGSFNEKAKKEILCNLLKAENEYNQMTGNAEHLITDDEIREIKKIWMRSSLDVNYIDEMMLASGREKVDVIQDSFELMNRTYEEQIKKILESKGLDYELLNSLVLFEKDNMYKNDKNAIQSFIDTTFKSDKVNF